MCPRDQRNSGRGCGCGVTADHEGKGHVSAILKKLTKSQDAAFDSSPRKADIAIDADVRAQRFTGAGASLTEASAELIAGLPEHRRTALPNDLFSSGGDGIGLGLSPPAPRRHGLRRPAAVLLVRGRPGRLLHRPRQQGSSGCSRDRQRHTHGARSDRPGPAPPSGRAFQIPPDSSPESPDAVYDSRNPGRVARLHRVIFPCSPPSPFRLPAPGAHGRRGPAARPPRRALRSPSTRCRTSRRCPVRHRRDRPSALPPPGARR